MKEKKKIMKKEEENICCGDGTFDG